MGLLLNSNNVDTQAHRLAFTTECAHEASAWSDTRLARGAGCSAS